MTKRQIYRKARENGYRISFGNQHYTRGRKRRDGSMVYSVCYDENGNPYKGYMVIDSSINGIVGGVSEVFTNTWDWEDVVEFVEGLPD